jgi:hypothetical protein
VIVEPVSKRMEQVIAPLFESMGKSTVDLCSRYTTRELAAIRDFAARCHQMAYEEARKVREGTVAGKAARGAKPPKRSGEKAKR